MRGVKVITPYSGVSYVREDYPALKTYFPLDEGYGGSFLDHAGGLIWSFDEVANTHSVQHAITHSSVSGQDESQANIHLTGDLPAPGVKQSLLIAVFGATEDFAIDGDFTYLRFGATVVGNDARFVLSMNSKSVPGNNCAKNWSANSGPSVSWTSSPNPCVVAIATIYSAGTLRSNYYVDSNLYTGLDATAQQMDEHGANIALSALGSAVTSLYSLQYWHFDAIPTDILAALEWTKASALAGNKTPYPGWRHRT